MLRKKFRLSVFVSSFALVFVLTPAAFAQPQTQIQVFSPELPDNREAYVADEVVVKFRGAAGFQRLRVGRGEVASTLQRLRGRTDVLSAEPNYIAYKQDVPTDPLFGLQWNFSNPIDTDINLPEARAVSTGQGVVVAVIDTGIAYENYTQLRTRYYLAPDFASTCFVAGYDFVNNDSHANDDESHGTHVAGTIAQSTNNTLGGAGIAPAVCLMPIKVLNSNGSGTYAAIADGIRFAADHGADVINLSLGGTAGSSMLEEALAYAYGKGVTIVAAAGNNGSGSVLYPAAYNQYVIAVGASRYDASRAGYSNYGSGLDVMAPGGDTSVDQNGDGYGDGILQNTFNPNTKNRSDFGYWFFQGTSMASPHVAGIAALVLANGNASGPDQVRSALESTALNLGPSGWDNEFGWGLVDAAAALSWSAGPVDQLPSVTVTNPAENATVSGTSQLTADANDDHGIARVDFYLDTTLLGSDSIGPYSLSWDSTGVADGNYTIIATAVDSIGQTASDSSAITVENVNEPPSPVEVFFESFESSGWLSHWSQDGQNDWFRSRQRATEGRYSVEIDGLASDATLISQPIDLQGKTSAAVSFAWLIENSLDAGEYVAFDTSTDGGAHWQEQRRLRGDQDPENVWVAEQVALSGISALRLRFRGTISGSGEDADLDAVRVIVE